MKLQIHRVDTMLAVALTIGILAPAALSQAPLPASPEWTNITGTVVSSSPTTLVIRGEGTQYHIFVYDRFTHKPATIPVGSVVKVYSTPSNEPGVRVATDITISTPPTPGQPAQAEPVPVAVRKVESDVQKQMKKYHLGIRGGASVDQETLLVGVHARLGPFFTRNAMFRPNVEFAFGEVTKLFAINLEGVYRLPVTSRTGGWHAYVGAGPSFTFLHRNFEEAAEGDNDIDFGDFEYHTGLNILTGIEYKSGVFFELKTTVWAVPHLRFIVGYNF